MSVWGIRKSNVKYESYRQLSNSSAFLWKDTDSPTNLLDNELLYQILFRAVMSYNIRGGPFPWNDHVISWQRYANYISRLSIKLFVTSQD